MKKKSNSKKSSPLYNISKLTNQNIKLYDQSREQTNRPPTGPYPTENFWHPDYNYGSWSRKKA